jgi:hypothetical protein
MAGVAYGKLELEIPEFAFDNFFTYEIGAVIAIRRVVLSYGFNHYSHDNLARDNFQNFGLGVRF